MQYLMILVLLTYRLSSKWTYFQRTVADTSELYQPLENMISEVFIPALLGKHISAGERELLELPCRLGGMNLKNPVKTADKNYHDSKHITRPLCDLIKHQDLNLEEGVLSIARAEVRKRSLEQAQKNDKNNSEEHKVILEKLSPLYKRCVELACQKGASIWLSTLPLAQFGFHLNRQEFQDSICLRYGWPIANAAEFCECGQKNSIDHSLLCKLGGFVHMRHNEVRDEEAEFASEVCRDVMIEPGLQPCNPEMLPKTSNTAQDARLDFCARGFWCPLQMAYFDKNQIKSKYYYILVIRNRQ